MAVHLLDPFPHLTSLSAVCKLCGYKVNRQEKEVEMPGHAVRSARNMVIWICGLDELLLWASVLMCKILESIYLKSIYMHVPLCLWGTFSYQTKTGIDFSTHRDLDSHRVGYTAGQCVRSNDICRSTHESSGA